MIKTFIVWAIIAAIVIGIIIWLHPTRTIQLNPTLQERVTKTGTVPVMKCVDGKCS